MSLADLKSQVEEFKAFLASDDCKVLLTRLGESESTILLGTREYSEVADFEAVWLSKSGLHCFAGSLDDWRLHGLNEANSACDSYRPAIPVDAVVAFWYSRREHESRVGRKLHSVLELLSAESG